MISPCSTPSYSDRPLKSMRHMLKAPFGVMDSFPGSTCNGAGWINNGSCFIAGARRAEYLTVHRFRVQRSGLRVKDKGKIRDPRFSRQMPVLPYNCQESVRFQIGDDEANASLINTLPKWTLGTR